MSLQSASGGIKKRLKRERCRCTAYDGVRFTGSEHETTEHGASADLVVVCWARGDVFATKIGYSSRLEQERALDIEKLLQTSTLGHDDALGLFRVLARADSIVLLGAGFLEDGTPGRVLRPRCDCEREMRRLLPKHRRTILSGRTRGVARVLGKDTKKSDVTEASLMKQYCGPDDATYVEEPLAIDTVGNVVFSSAWLSKFGLSQPVFISQASHLTGRVDKLAEHWFKSSGTPRYWPIPDPDPEAALRQMLKDGSDFYRDRRRGVGHVFQFIDDVPPLSADSRLRKATLEHAVEWLFLNDERYPEEFKNLDNLLRLVPGLDSNRGRRKR